MANQPGKGDAMDGPLRSAFVLLAAVLRQGQGSLPACKALLGEFEANPDANLCKTGVGRLAADLHRSVSRVRSVVRAVAFAMVLLTATVLRAHAILYSAFEFTRTRRVRPGHRPTLKRCRTGLVAAAATLHQ